MKYHVEFDIDFRRNEGSGFYIALEGVDGCGKTTQLEQLKRYFENQGEEVVVTREPRNDGLVGSLIRQVLQSKISVPSVALQYLFSADRSIHHQEIILPALKEGKTVISDRCFWSAIVYGVLDKTNGISSYDQADLLLISQSILSMYHQFTMPDNTFYLKISLNTALKRIEEQGKKREIYEEKEKLAHLIEGYEWLSKRFESEIAVIDGEKSVKEVTDDIRAKIAA